LAARHDTCASTNKEIRNAKRSSFGTILFHTKKKSVVIATLYFDKYISEKTTKKEMCGEFTSRLSIYKCSKINQTIKQN
jgi:hypothetical protein